MKLRFILIALLVLPFAFQNCSPEHFDPDRQPASFDMSKNYPYSTRTDFFENVQFTGYDLTGSDHYYKLAASAAFADDPAEIIDVEILILDDADNSVCPRYSGRMNNGNNAIVINDCSSTTKHDFLKVEIRAKTASESVYQLVNTYELDLSSVVN